eukprot:g2889.t1
MQREMLMRLNQLEQTKREAGLLAALEAEKTARMLAEERNARQLERQEQAIARMALTMQLRQEQAKQKAELEKSIAALKSALRDQAAKAEVQTIKAGLEKRMEALRAERAHDLLNQQMQQMQRQIEQQIRSGSGQGALSDAGVAQIELRVRAEAEAQRILQEAHDQDKITEPLFSSSSHSQATGGDQANAIYLELERMGFKVWYDNRADDLTKEGMLKGIEEAAAFVLFLSN